MEGIDLDSLLDLVFYRYYIYCGDGPIGCPEDNDGEPSVLLTLDKKGRLYTRPLYMVNADGSEYFDNPFRRASGGFSRHSTIDEEFTSPRYLGTISMRDALIITNSADETKMTWLPSGRLETIKWLHNTLNLLEQRLNLGAYRKEGFPLTLVKTADAYPAESLRSMLELKKFHALEAGDIILAESGHKKTGEKRYVAVVPVIGKHDDVLDVFRREVTKYTVTGQQNKNRFPI